MLESSGKDESDAERVYRLYKLEGLSVRTKRRKKRGSPPRIILRHASE